MSDKMKPPEKIYLTGEIDDDLGDLLWSEDNIREHDTEYTRSDLVQEAILRERNRCAKIVKNVWAYR